MSLLASKQTRYSASVQVKGKNKILMFTVIYKPNCPS